MDLIHRRIRLAAILLLGLSLSPNLAPLAAQTGEEDDAADIAVDRWLVAGPVAAPLPAFAGETGVARREALELGALLPEWPWRAGEPWPEAGAALRWPGAGEIAWGERQGETLALGDGGGGRPRLAWVASFVEVDRFVAAQLTVSTPHLARVFLDGEQVAEKAAADAAPEGGDAAGTRDEGGDGAGDAEDVEEEETSEDVDGRERGEEGGEEGEGDEGDEDDEDEVAEPPAADAGRPGSAPAARAAAQDAGAAADEEGEAAAPGTATAELALHTGKHLLVIATLTDPEAGRPWELSASLSVPAERAAAVAVSASPARGVTIRDLLDPPQVAAVDLSADGELVAVTLEQPAVPADGRATWVEIVRAADGAPVRTLRLPTAVAGFAWAPAGRAFAYRTSAEGEGTLWIGDLASGRLEPLVENVEGLGGFLWAPDGASLFVQISEKDEPEDPERGAVRVRSMADRWAGFRDLGHLHQVAAADGRMRRLTAGPFTTALEDVSPDGRRLLLSRTHYGLESPFSRGELWELDLGTLEPSLLREVVWFGSAAYSPNGARVLVLAGPSAFGEAGLDVPAGTAPNEYDGQAYVLDRASGEVAAISRDFDPAIVGAEWSRHDGAVYLAVAETSFGNLYRWEPVSRRFTRLDAGPDVASGLSLARTSPALAYTGSSLQEPEAAWVMPRPGAAGRRLLAPSADDFEQVRFGRVEDFDFTTGDGVVIPGRLYYPLDFDPARKYPLLTYYYGGVVPTDRSFGGRYPKNLWAANGYAVYVLQPSGAVGFGQQRSAVHVNDWGERVVAEIVAGVDAVIAAHPFLDGSKVGCFGGSYGGFLTMSLLTDSDRCSAAISHAGISGIASYWGEGWWGYLYMATAAHGSYPWNRPDVFVERSPLFKADRVQAPLLLIHGTADPNVPPGESDQMFAALRVLGKEVEYVRIADEAHWILSYPKRVLWWRTILAWFDRTLKAEPEGWEELWGEELDRGGP
jgi:dipeptidyl aminopeptidase/acylaminoacyl peptidase